MATRTIPLPFEVHLGWTCAPLRLGRHDPTIRVSARTVVRATRTPDGPATLQAEHLGHAIEVETWGDGGDWALEHAPGLLGTLDDRTGFDPTHRLIARLHRDMPGLRLPRTDRLVEALVPAVLGQRVTGFEATRSYRQLIERWGEPAPGPGGLLLQPLPGAIAELGYYDLHVIGIEKKRADTLKRVAAHAARLGHAGTLTDAEQRARVEGIPGVGPWTSAEAARVAFGDADAVSVGDHHLKHLVSWALAGEPQGSDARMLELLEPFAGHRARVCRLLELAHRAARRRGPRQRIEPLARR